MNCVISILALCLLPPGKIDKPKPVVVNGYCEIYQPIIASRRDTAETLAQIRTANATRRKLCKNPG